MGFFGWLKRLVLGEDKLAAFDRAYRQGSPHRTSAVHPARRAGAAAESRSSDADSFDIEALAARLDFSPRQLRSIEVSYASFQLPKRTGGHRTIHAPNDALKAVQRRLLRRVLGPLDCHAAACGFEKRRSIVSHARRHEGRAVVVCMDIKAFFPCTAADRVAGWFRQVGWEPEAVEQLLRLCTHEGGLPQGAPTSPRLSNLVNGTLDARLEGLARSLGARYSRYADDLTFSFERDDRRALHALPGSVKKILADHGYRLHQRKKLRIRRRHQCQAVTGLVVNHRANLPRTTRRWLRAVEHRLACGRRASLTPAELDGWKALRTMIDR